LYPDLIGRCLFRCIGCPALHIAQFDPSNRIDYDVLIRFSSSYMLSIHVNTSLQLFHPLEKNLN
jgi:hypothetical protein